MRVILRPAAAADIEEAFLWYEDRESGLGHEFLEAVQSVLTNVGAQPRAYPVIHRNTRRALLRRFPYGLFYRTYDEETVVVVACMHARRNPKEWRSRT